MPKCTIKKFSRSLSEQEVAGQLAFCAQLTEPTTNGFYWPDELMQVKTPEDLDRAIAAILVKEEYDLKKLRERGYVPQEYWWVLDEGGRYIGLAKIRYLLTPKLLIEGGHVGCGLLEAYRGQGYGKEMLARVLEECKKNGLPDVLLTVLTENEPSRRMVEANGGELWDSIEREDGTTCVRYWVNLR